jgi:hypothetical protein
MFFFCSLLKNSLAQHLRLQDFTLGLLKLCTSWYNGLVNISVTQHFHAILYIYVHLLSIKVGEMQYFSLVHSTDFSTLFTRVLWLPNWEKV